MATPLWPLHNTVCVHTYRRVHTYWRIYTYRRVNCIGTFTVAERSHTHSHTHDPFTTVSSRLHVSAHSHVSTVRSGAGVHTRIGAFTHA